MKNKESQALIEVLEWKDLAYNEVKNLDLNNALNKRMIDSIETADKLNIKTVKLIKK